MIPPSFLLSEGLLLPIVVLPCLVELVFWQTKSEAKMVRYCLFVLSMERFHQTPTRILIVKLGMDSTSTRSFSLGHMPERMLVVCVGPKERICTQKQQH